MSSKLSGLTATTAVVDADLLYVAKSPFGTTDSKKITMANFRTSLLGAVGTITASTSAGAIIEAANGTDVALFGAGNTANVAFYGGITAVGSMQSAYSIVNISASTTLTDVTRGLTKASNLVTVPYLNAGYVGLVMLSNTDDNATKPKAGIWCDMTGAGSDIFIGTSQDYATGITNALQLNSFGKFILNATTTNGASLNIPSGTAPTSPVNGDVWQDGTNIKMQIGGLTKTFTLI